MTTVPLHITQVGDEIERSRPKERSKCRSYATPHRRPADAGCRRARGPVGIDRLRTSSATNWSRHASPASAGWSDRLPHAMSPTAATTYCSCRTGAYPGRRSCVAGVADDIETQTVTRPRCFLRPGPEPHGAAERTPGHPRSPRKVPRYPHPERLPSPEDPTSMSLAQTTSPVDVFRRGDRKRSRRRTTPTPTSSPAPSW